MHTGQNVSQGIVPSPINFSWHTIVGEPFLVRRPMKLTLVGITGSCTYCSLVTLAFCHAWGLLGDVIILYD
jgi:hypothetical protein